MASPENAFCFFCNIAIFIPLAPFKGEQELRMFFIRLWFCLNFKEQAEILSIANSRSAKSPFEGGWGMKTA
ncbi:MAG: hypothetical protein ACXWXW_11535 [Bacteroidia bacterium]